MGTVLAILLTILKWIGLILLGILILIAAIILLVIVLLTIPIRVRAKGAFDQKKEILDLNADISYFLKLVHARIFLRDKKMAWQLKIAGKTIRSSKPPDEAEAEPAGTAETPETAEKSDTAETSGAAEKTESGDTAAAETAVAETKAANETVAASAEGKTETVELTDKTDEDAGTTEEPGKKPDTEPDKPDKKAAKSKKKTKDAKKSETDSTDEDGVPEWAVEIMEPIEPTKIEALEEKIGALLAKIDHYYALYEEAPGKRKVIRALFRMIGRMLRQFWFRNSEIRAVYGLADPGTMGTIQAVVGMLGCYIPDKGLRLEVDPDFQEENIHVDADLRLRIHIQAFIHYALCFVFNWHVLKLVFYVIRVMRREKDTEGKTDKKNNKKSKKSKNKQEQEQCADHAVERSNS